ncbi:MAG: DUF3108 domain-containing protein [Candidatus Marinimicrobia bacterium]|nr:DUF3108 domain-containing protein [Candidatus Neomarinimicrobiota bacterium]
MPKFKTIGVIIILASSLLARNKTEVINYEVSYLRIPLVNMTLTWVEDDSTVRVSYENRLKPFINVIHPVHNIYRVEFRKEDFHPLSWSKSISEGDMQFQLSARRSGDGRTVAYSNGSRVAFPADGLTVFSATHFLASKAHDPAFFPTTLPVFIDGELWEATATRYDARHPHPNHGVAPGEILIQTELHYSSGSPLIQRNDVLTNEIAKEGTQFFLWVQKDGTYSRAQFGKFPKAVVLKRLKN